MKKENKGRNGALLLGREETEVSWIFFDRERSGEGSERIILCFFFVLSTSQRWVAFGSTGSRVLGARCSMSYPVRGWSGSWDRVVAGRASGSLPGGDTVAHCCPISFCQPLFSSDQRKA